MCELTWVWCCCDSPKFWVVIFFNFGMGGYIDKRETTTTTTTVSNNSLIPLRCSAWVVGSYSLVIHVTRYERTDEKIGETRFLSRHLRVDTSKCPYNDQLGWLVARQK